MESRPRFWFTPVWHHAVKLAACCPEHRLCHHQASSISHSQLYNFTVQVTDSATPPNVGTQAFTLRLLTPVSLKATTYNTGQSPDAVIAEDFNKDGNLDLAIANKMDGTVSILLGNGNGTFTAQPTLATGNHTQLARSRRFRRRWIPRSSGDKLR